MAAKWFLLTRQLWTHFTPYNVFNVIPSNVRAGAGTACCQQAVVFVFCFFCNFCSFSTANFSRLAGIFSLRRPG